MDGKLKSLRQRTFGAPFSDEDNWREVSGDYEGIVAHVFTQNGTPVVAGFGFSSESGDWALDATYYYRTNGTLAKKHELLKTFYGNASVTKDSLYTCAGRLLSKTTHHLDLKTKLEKAPDPEFVDEDSPAYKRVQDLPFSHLLTTHAK